VTRTPVTRMVKLGSQPAVQRSMHSHTAIAAVSVILLHGQGGSQFDELFIFGGIGLVLAVLGFLSWRAGRQRKKRESKRGRHD
jgi:hypothetical protein